MRKIQILTAILTAIVALAVTAISADAAYVIHSVRGNVIVTSRGNSRRAAKGEEIHPSDKVTISPGAVLEIRNDETNAIYTSINHGDMAVSQLMHDSKARASNHRANVNSRLNFSGGRTKGVKSSRVYAERGVVTRSMAAFDSTAAVIIRPNVMAQLLAYMIDSGETDSDSSLNYAVIPTRADAVDADTGKEKKGHAPGLRQRSVTPSEYGFKLHNPLKTPIYFNVIQISGLERRRADISPLGSPFGPYIILPGQTISRTLSYPISADERHFLVAANYGFEIDDLVRDLDRILNDGTSLSSDPEKELSIFVREIY